MKNNDILLSLAEELGHCLQQQNLMLATAESCTGGWIAQAITAIARSSVWFDRGFVTYSNTAKQEMLGVSQKTLATEGAVSEATVLAMVKGALARSQAQVAIAVSGIAGPGGGTSTKPVGTVWIAYGLPHTAGYAKCYLFDGDRTQIRQQVVITALQDLLENLCP